MQQGIKLRQGRIVGLFLIMVVLVLGLLMACNRKEEAAPMVASLSKPAPLFTLKDTKEISWDLKSLRGKVVFINFWATWCPPCRKELPSMQELFMALPPSDFVMLTILSNDKPAFADALAAKLGCTFPILVDPESKAAKAYGITGVPETFIVDRNGILREKVIGPWEWNSSEARQLLGKYLRKN